MKTEYIEVNSHGRILRGLKHISECESDITFLIVHGYFSSNKIGPHRLYVHIADMVCNKYGDCYRFDLSGMGESDGDISQTTLTTHVEDLISILNHFKEVGIKNLVVIAHCMGCNIVLETIKTTPVHFREIIFLSPYFTNEKILRLFFKEPNQLEDLYVKGYTYRNGLYTDRSFFLEKSFYDNFINSINASNCYINIIAAGKDQFIPLECNESLRTNGQNISFAYISDSDHNFLHTRQELFDKISELIEDNHNS